MRVPTWCFAFAHGRRFAAFCALCIVCTNNRHINRMIYALVVTVHYACLFVPVCCLFAFFFFLLSCICSVVLPSIVIFVLCVVSHLGVGIFVPATSAGGLCHTSHGVCLWQHLSITTCQHAMGRRQTGDMLCLATNLLSSQL